MTEHGTDLTGDFAHRGGAALVVGGNGRLGAAICRELAVRGSDVALTYRTNRATAESLAADISEWGRRAWTMGLELEDQAGSVASVEAASWQSAMATGRGSRSRPFVSWHRGEPDPSPANISASRMGLWHRHRIGSTLPESRQLWRSSAFTTRGGPRWRPGSSAISRLATRRSRRPGHRSGDADQR